MVEVMKGMTYTTEQGREARVAKVSGFHAWVSIEVPGSLRRIRRLVPLAAIRDLLGARA